MLGSSHYGFTQRRGLIESYSQHNYPIYNLIYICVKGKQGKKFLRTVCRDSCTLRDLLLVIGAWQFLV